MRDLSWLTASPITHRGLHDLNRAVWENTLPAFEASVERGYAIECDVHLSRDGVPVVFHDHALNRLTGRDGFLFELSAAELGGLPIGTTSERAPTLPQMLDLVRGRVPVVIELKGTRGRDDGLVAAVADILSRYRGEAAIMSFWPHLVRCFRKDAPRVAAGLTAEVTTPRALEAHFSMLAHGVEFCSFNVLELPNPFVTFMRETLGRPVITWTAKTPELAQLSRLHADQMTFEGFTPREPGAFLPQA